MRLPRWSIIKAVYIALAAMASTAQAECNFPGAVERALPIPHTFYVHFADAADVDLEYLLVAAGEIRIWDVRKGSEEAFVCIEASTSATCSNGVGVCAHAIATPDLAEIKLVSSTHEIGFASDGSDNWPDLRVSSTTYDGIFQETFVYDMGQYHGLGRIKTAPYP